MQKQSHTLDMLFPLGVLALFAGAVITVLLMTASVYQRNVEQSAGDFSGPTALAYITEKLHQSDCAGTVSLGSIDGTDALVLSVELPSGSYDTYIYCYGGSLRELMVKRELPVEAAMGRELIALKAFQVQKISDSLLQLRCTDSSDTVREALVALRSGEVG